jgi:dipeptidyl-peptidase-4
VNPTFVDDGATRDSFPRLFARTQRFTLGVPRNITVTSDGATVLFVRSVSGVDRTGCLWAFDVEAGTERLLVDPRKLTGDAGEELSAAERARRERARESAAGIVAYSADPAGTVAVFALSGSLWACRVKTGETHCLPTQGAVIDPRIDPTGRRIAYASSGALRVIGVDGAGDRALVESDSGTVVWGQAEFVAAEEMDRARGFWWAPDGASLLVERYDEAPVQVWYIADPAHPDRQPAPQRYPAAGTANADVTLWHVTLDGARHQIPWDMDGFPYLARVSWSDVGAVLQVLSRDQRRAQILRPHLPGAAAVPAERDVAAQGEPGRACEIVDQRTDSAWIDLVPGLPALAPDGRLLSDITDGEAGVSTRRLTIDGAAISPPGLQLLAVLDVVDSGVLATVSADPVEQQLVLIGYDGTVRELSSGPGVHSGAIGGETVVIAGSRLDDAATTITVSSHGTPVGELRSLAEPAPFTPRVTMLTVGERDLRAALVLPRGHRPGSARLPVIMAPYGGPHAQQVRASGRLFLQAQWLADQGFAVIVADGRGTPARGPAWEREIRNDFASVTLADQVDALAGVAERYPDDIDTARVGIMGWSYGGYLSALAVLDRPDVFHAAVAGAPVTDWALYDTCYTERYLGDPADQPDVYRRNSLIDRAPALTRPLMLIHGLADDNVVVAHTLRLSAALLAAGKPHQVLPLTGMTHMASDEVVAENLLLAQVEFLRRSLG